MKKIKNFPIFILISFLFLMLLCVVGCSPKTQVNFNINCDNHWTEDSTPFIVHIQGDNVDMYHALDKDSQNLSMSFDKGNYTCDVISPVNNDGTYYRIKSDSNLNLEKDTAVNVDTAFVPFSEITKDELSTIGKKIDEATEKGDDTLQGDKGKEIKDKYKKNEKAYEDKVAQIEAEKQAAEQAAQQQAAAQEKSASKLAGTWTMAAPAGGYRGSLISVCPLINFL